MGNAFEHWFNWFGLFLFVFVRVCGTGLNAVSAATLLFPLAFLKVVAIETAIDSVLYKSKLAQFCLRAGAAECNLREDELMTAVKGHGVKESEIREADSSKLGTPRLGMGQS